MEPAGNGPCRSRNRRRGGIPRLIEGYRDVRDLTRLVAAMQEVGLSPEDIKGYMGGNLYRVLQKCIG
jgi:microsomal dipeptidase-like Zn-dependent dipeptidase